MEISAKWAEMVFLLLCVIALTKLQFISANFFMVMQGKGKNKKVQKLDFKNVELKNAHLTQRKHCSLHCFLFLSFDVR